MTRQDAERIITENLKPIFGFALKRCENTQDAEDLAQDIVLKAFRAFLIRDDIADPGKFLWTIAHNALSNYYRDGAKFSMGVPLEDIPEDWADPEAFFEEDDRETAARLQLEIAYLSKLQRRIVIAFYFENKPQAKIAEELGIPVGTVKWHLFEAKKDLRKWMETMRKTGELKFNPIRFTSSYISGSPGKKSFDEFFRSPLTQNLCYCVRYTAKTVQEIADELGVSPVYVESEVEFLAEYGFLLEEKGKYIANFIIEESTSELLTLRDSMYKQAAVPFANELFDELTSSGILDDPAIVCHQTDESLTANMHPKADRNFLLWSLLPFAAAWSGEHLMEEKVSFEEAATIRPDGGHYIFHAVVQPESLVLPDDYVHMRNWNGPMWQRNGRQAIWQVDSDWSGREPSGERDVPNELRRTLNLYNAFKEGTASKSDIAWLAERGYVKVAGDCRYAWQIVLLESSEIRRKLLAVGDRLKEKYKAEFDRIKAAFVEAELRATPKHLRKQKEYTQQHIFHSDGMFLLHCITALLQSGKLHPPTEGQRKALTTVIFNM